MSRKLTAAIVVFVLLTMLGVAGLFGWVIYRLVEYFL